MSFDDFIEFINKKTGMKLKSTDMDHPLTELAEWDSLTFVYMIIEFENEEDVKLDIEQLLSCCTLGNIFEVITNEIRENK